MCVDLYALQNAIWLTWKAHRFARRVFRKLNSIELRMQIDTFLYKVDFQWFQLDLWFYLSFFFYDMHCGAVLVCLYVCWGMLILIPSVIKCQRFAAYLHMYIYSSRKLDKWVREQWLRVWAYMKSWHLKMD